MLRFVIAFYMAFLVAPSIFVDDGGGAWAKASSAAKKSKKKSKKVAKKSKKTAHKAKAKAKKAGEKAKKVSKKAAEKLGDVASNPDNVVAGIQMAKATKNGDYQGAANIGANAAGQGETLSSAEGAVKAAKDGNYEKAAEQGGRAGAYGSGNGQDYDTLAGAAKSGDDEGVANVVSKRAAAHHSDDN